MHLDDEFVTPIPDSDRCDCGKRQKHSHKSYGQKQRTNSELRFHGIEFLSACSSRGFAPNTPPPSHRCQSGANMLIASSNVDSRRKSSGR